MTRTEAYFGKDVNMNSQSALMDQLYELRALGNKAGLYDAVDWVEARMRSATANHRRNDRRRRLFTEGGKPIPFPDGVPTSSLTAAASADAEA